MFFTFQKIVWFLVLPPAGLMILMLPGLFARRGRIRRGLLIAGFLLLYLLSLPTVSDLLLEPLEKAVPAPAAYDSADAVVVPGGGSVDVPWGSPVPNAESWTRLAKGMEIAWKLGVPLVLAGGNGEPFATGLSDADVMAEAAAASGFPRKGMIVENRSKNTLENSIEVRKVVKGNRIVLATSAYYMRRAKRMFERRGFDVIPAPTNYMVQKRRMTPALLIPRAGALAASSTALAEWLSLGWWRLRGEI
jgi:uncharacterized SAM-binding protein YcdF (DUF218 family)